MEGDAKPLSVHSLPVCLPLASRVSQVDPSVWCPFLLEYSVRLSQMKLLNLSFDPYYIAYTPSEFPVLEHEDKFSPATLIKASNYKSICLLIKCLIQRRAPNI